MQLLPITNRNPTPKVKPGLPLSKVTSSLAFLILEVMLLGLLGTAGGLWGTCGWQVGLCVPASFECESADILTYFD